MILFCFPLKITLFLPFQNREKVLFTAETVTQQNGPMFAKQTIDNLILQNSILAKEI